jgi:hypothetical protein
MTNHTIKGASTRSMAIGAIKLTVFGALDMVSQNLPNGMICFSRSLTWRRRVELPGGMVWNAPDPGGVRSVR